LSEALAALDHRIAVDEILRDALRSGTLLPGTAATIIAFVLNECGCSKQEEN
jgi:hypothetical protein